MIIVTSPYRFRASIILDEKVLRSKDSLIDSFGRFFTIFAVRFPSLKKHKSATFKISTYKDDGYEHNTSEFLLLADDADSCALKLGRRDIIDKTNTFFQGNGRGGMLRPCLKWGEIDDRYNALLAANLDKNLPVDRHIMFTRARAWVLRQGRSEELCINTTESFTINSNGGGTWTFHVPVGNGLYVDISLAAVMLNEKNAIRITVLRHSAEGRKHYLPDDSLVHFILRPDIEDRNFHHDTKLNDGLKKHWISSIKSTNKGFIFSPTKERKLIINTTRGKFEKEPEFSYSICRETEAERGFDPHSDLFSPGYFGLDLAGGEHDEKIAQVLTPEENKKIDPRLRINLKNILDTADNSFERVLLRSIKQFVVNRDNLKTVIAGYPWFLDWGRDTLICARGLIAAGMLDDVKEILLQFAKFTEGGKLPNVIH